MGLPPNSCFMRFSLWLKSQFRKKNSLVDSVRKPHCFGMGNATDSMSPSQSTSTTAMPTDSSSPKSRFLDFLPLFTLFTLSENALELELSSSLMLTSDATVSITDCSSAPNSSLDRTSEEPVSPCRRRLAALPATEFALFWSSRALSSVWAKLVFSMSNISGSNSEARSWCTVLSRLPSKQAKTILMAASFACTTRSAPTRGWNLLWMIFSTMAVNPSIFTRYSWFPGQGPMLHSIKKLMLVHSSSTSASSIFSSMALSSTCATSNSRDSPTKFTVRAFPTCSRTTSCALRLWPSHMSCNTLNVFSQLW
mmetsp:Transcript_82788/g.161332  ORF Transcript_82788/g.161332 Transcript_82788/m.161332 type:complete len:309 (-) Transcript_82788:321-1247(-)